MIHNVTGTGNISTEEAIKKNYLSNKKVFLKPVTRRGNKMITDPSHIGYFMWEGAKKSYCLPMDEHGILVNPFESEEEKEFFESLLDTDLNPRKRDNKFWNTFYVVISKTAEFMSKGKVFDLSDPLDNIRYRVLKLQRREVAPNWDARFERPTYKFALVEEDYEEKEDNLELERMEAIFTFWGTIKSSTKKMKEFLGAYFMHKKINKEVGNDATEKFLVSEIQKIIKSDGEIVHKLINDENLPIKYFILNAVKIGAIKKLGVGTYIIVGEEKEYNLEEIISHIKFLKESTDPIYLKMEAQVNNKK